MDYFVPYDQLGVAPPGPWQNASPAAGLKGSILNALVFPAVQGEILSVQDAAGLTRNAADFTQLLQALKILIPKYAPVATGAANNGGLAKDASSNFLLALLNLVADNRAAPVGADILALERNADGTTVSVSASAFASFVLSSIVQSASLPQLSSNTVAGFSVGPDTAIPLNAPTVAPLVVSNLPAGIGTFSNGVFTVAKAGWYIIVADGAMFVTSNVNGDDAFFQFNIAKKLGSSGSTSGTLQSASASASNTQAIGDINVTTVQYLNVGDQISLQVLVKTLSGNGTSPGLSGFTNMLIAFLNA